MKKIVLFVFVFSSFSVFSQNYDLLIPDQVNYFTDYKDFVPFSNVLVAGL